MIDVGEKNPVGPYFNGKKDLQRRHGRKEKTSDENATYSRASIEAVPRVIRVCRGAVEKKGGAGYQFLLSKERKKLLLECFPMCNMCLCELCQFVRVPVCLRCICSCDKKKRWDG